MPSLSKLEMTNVSIETRLTKKGSDIKTEQNTPDVKPDLMSLQNIYQDVNNPVSSGTRESLGNVSARRTEDGINAHTSNVSPPQCQGYDLVNASSIDWCRGESTSGGESTKALVQLVHTDHPYRCQSSDDLQFPTKSNSCSSIPDAELMQDFFLHTTNMISYQPIAEHGCLPAPKTTTTLIGFDHGTSDSDSAHATNQSMSQTINPAHVGRPPNVVYKGSEYGLGNAIPRDVFNVNGTTSKRPQVPVGNSPQKPEPCRLTAEVASASEATADVDKASERNRPFMEMDNNLQGKKPECMEKAECSTSYQDRPSVPIEDQSNESTSRRPNKISTPFKRGKYFKKDGKYCKKDESRWQKMESEKQLWMSACKALSDKVEEDIILNSAVNLMIKMWTDYLNLTFEEVRQREIETARELNQCDEVIEMLEDKGRYVWQIIEEDIKPRTCYDVDNESMEFL